MKKHFLDQRRNVLRLFWAFSALCGALLLFDLAYHKHVAFSWEGWFGFYAIFGLIGVTAIVLGAKELRRLVMRREDYYDR